MRGRWYQAWSRWRSGIALSLFFVPLAWAEEGATKKGDSVKQETGAKGNIEIRVEERRQLPDRRENASTADSPKATVILSIAGEGKEKIEAAIDKIESQLKASGLSNELQEKALRALRQGLKDNGSRNGRVEAKATVTASGEEAREVKKGVELKSAKGNEGAKGNRERVEERRIIQVNPLTMMMTREWSLTPEQRKKLENAILETLEVEKIDAETIERIRGKVKDLLADFRFHPASSIAPPSRSFRIGILIQTEANDEGQEGKIRVGKVFEATPAAEAGIQEGDELLRVDEQSVKTAEELTELVEKAGQEDRNLRIVVKRDGTEHAFDIKPSKTSSSFLESTPNYPAPMGPNFPNFGPMPGSFGFVMPPAEWENLQNNPAFKEALRDAAKGASRAGQRAFDAMREAWGEMPRAAEAEDAHEPLEKELKELREEMNEMRSLMEKLLEKK